MAKNSTQADGEKVRAKRLEQGWSQSELARKAKVDRGTVANIESDKTVTRAKLSNVYRALGLDRQKLICPDLIQVDATPLAIQEHIERFDTYVQEKRRDFKGRGFVFEAVNHFICQQGQQSGYFVIRGDPGIGKSALLAQLVKEYPHLLNRPARLIYHFNIATRGIVTSKRFLENVCAQLIAAFQLPYLQLPDEFDRDGMVLGRLLGEAAQLLRNEECLIVAIDALDEVDVGADRPGANPLYLPEVLPQGVFVIATSRPRESTRFLAANGEDWTLDAGSEENLKDVGAFIESWASRKGVQEWIHKEEWCVAQFVDVMRERSKGNFMYLRHVLSDMNRGSYHDVGATGLPLGLRAYYRDHWRRMGMTATPLPEAKIRIIYALSTAPVPMRRARLAYLAEESELEVQEVLDEWEEFVSKDASKEPMEYSLYHWSFRDFLERRSVVQAAGISLKRMNAHIGRTLFDEFFDK